MEILSVAAKANKYLKMAYAYESEMYAYKKTPQSLGGAGVFVMPRCSWVSMAQMKKAVT